MPISPNRDYGGKDRGKAYEMEKCGYELVSMTVTLGAKAMLIFKKE